MITKAQATAVAFDEGVELGEFSPELRRAIGRYWLSMNVIVLRIDPENHGWKGYTGAGRIALTIYPHRWRHSGSGLRRSFVETWYGRVHTAVRRLTREHASVGTRSFTDLPLNALIDQLTEVVRGRGWEIAFADQHEPTGLLGARLCPSCDGEP